MSKHTPGPITAEQLYAASMETNYARFWLRKGAERITELEAKIAELRARIGSPLIASAPEMYDLLRDTARSDNMVALVACSEAARRLLARIEGGGA